MGACTGRAADSAEHDDSDGKILLGFSQIGAESAWRTYNSKSVQEAAQAAGIQLLFSNAEQKQENQIKAIRSFIVYRVDVIAFVPIVQDGWDNVLREAKAAHIPVIVCDRKLVTSDESLYDAYIGTDSVEEGRRAARFLQQKFAVDGTGARGASVGSASAARATVNILELRGTDGSSASEGRMQGFREQLAGDARFRIVYSESGNFIRSRGREIARTLLAANGDQLRIGATPVDVIFSANDGMTLGFLEELNAHGITTGADITVVTVDAQQEAIDRLRAGEINCVIECKPDIGSNIMATAKRLVAGKSVPRELHVDEQVFTEFDDLAAIAPRAY